MASSSMTVTVTDWISAGSAGIAAIAAIVSVVFSYRAKKADEKAAESLRRMKFFSSVLPKRDAYDQMLNESPRLYSAQNYSSGSQTKVHINQLNRATLMLLEIAKAEHLAEGTIASTSFILDELSKVASAYPATAKIEATWTLPKEILDVLSEEGKKLDDPNLNCHLGRVKALENT